MYTKSNYNKAVQERKKNEYRSWFSFEQKTHTEQCCPARRKTRCLSRVYTAEEEEEKKNRAKKRNNNNNDEHCHAKKKKKKKQINKLTKEN